jgi:hypothetical protein
MGFGLHVVPLALGWTFDSMESLDAQFDEAKVGRLRDIKEFNENGVGQGLGDNP